MIPMILRVLLLAVKLPFHFAVPVLAVGLCCAVIWINVRFGYTIVLLLIEKVVAGLRLQNCQFWRRLHPSLLALLKYVGLWLNSDERE